MRRIRLPEDIRQMQKRWIGIRVSVMLLLLLGEAILFYFAGDYLMNGFGIPNTLAIFLGLTLVVFHCLGLTRWLLDRPWQGVVESVYVDSVWGADPTGKRIRNRNEIQLILKREDGSSVTKTFSGKKLVCREGDAVYHFRGLPFELVLRNGVNAEGVCPVCGAKNPTEARCHHCGHTVVR